MIGVAAAVATMLVLGVLFVVALDALAQRWALRRVQPG